MIRRSLFLAFADKSAGTLLSVGMMIVISRLLTPAEVGLFLVASAAVILIESFRDFGIASCIIQEHDLTPAFLRTAFTLVAALSAVFGVGLCAGAGLLARLYGSDELELLLTVAAISFVAAPFSAVRLALMKRDMHFGRVAGIGVISNTAVAITSVGFALAGTGALSLALGSVAGALVTTLLAVILRPEVGSLRPSLSEWRRILPFGVWASIVTVLSLALESFPRLVLGRVLGFTAVGLFSRSVSLTQLPEKLLLNAVQPVVLPAFSASVRAGRGLGDSYVLALTLVASLQWPALLCLAIFAEPVVLLLLGDQWTGVVPLLRITSLAGMALFPASLAFPVLVAMGRVRDLALLNLFLVPVTMVTFIVSAQFGLMAVAWSLTVLNPLNGLATLVVIRRRVPFAIGDLLRMLSRSLAAALCSAAVPAVVMLTVNGSPGPAEAALALGGAICGWVAGLFVARHPLAGEMVRLAGAAGRARARPRAV